MTYDEFKLKLKEHNLDLKEFGEHVGMKYSGITKWNLTPTVPLWVDRYFELYEENKKLNKFKTMLLEIADKLKK